ncbi:glycosyltransferase, partial [Sphaerisporangium rufum]|uniref:glycosyltransferase n=1 Tax=Sphaerisporangium rufum TaxID=1381558 RepID=UPI00195091E8
MRISLISEHASPLAAVGGVDAGGQNVHVAMLATALGRRGHQVTVHTRRTDGRQPDTVEMAPGVTVEHVTAGPPEPVPKDELLPYMPAFADRLARGWSRARPDVAHAHFWMSGLAASSAARRLGVPVAQTFHALGVVKRRWQGGADTSPAGRAAAERDLARDVDAVIATCSDEVRELRAMGTPHARISVVPCGVDLDLFTPDGPAAARADRPRVLSIGRMVARKGVDTIVRALDRLPEAELLIAGGAPDDAEVARLAELVAAHGVAGRVRLVGSVARPDVP